LFDRVNSPAGRPLRRRRRFGLLAQLLLFLILGTAFFLLVTAVFAPWGYYLGGQLVLDDHKTLSNAFLPDGNLYKAHDSTHPGGGEATQVTLKEGTYTEFEAACGPPSK
jgi:uncharacterized iron-regulated membrane protein